MHAGQLTFSRLALPNCIDELKAAADLSASFAICDSTHDIASVSRDDAN